MSKYCVIFGKHKKLLNHTDIEEAAIRNLFNIGRSKDIFFQYYNTEENEYFDITNLQNISELNTKRILVQYEDLSEQNKTETSLEKSMDRDTSLPVTTSSDTIILDPAEPIEICELDSNFIFNLDKSCMKKLNEPMSLSNINKELEIINLKEEIFDEVTIDHVEIFDEITIDHVTPVESLTKKKNHDLPLHHKNSLEIDKGLLFYKYTLPVSKLKSSSLVHNFLKSKLAFSMTKKSVKIRILDILHEDYMEKISLSSELSEPSSKVYGAIGNALLTEYPHLTGSLDYFKALKLIRNSLNSKFNNMKCRSKKNHSYNNSYTKTNKDKSDTNKHPMYKLPNYRPDISASESNQKVLNSHITYMKEAVLRNPIKYHENIKQKMCQTFTSRRNYILNDEDVTPEKVLTEYPALKSENIIVQEMRMMCQKNVSEMLSFVLSKLAISLSAKSSKAKYKEWLKDLFDHCGTQDKERIDNLSLLAEVAVKLNEDPKNIIGNTVTTNGPFLKISRDGKCALYINQKLFLNDINHERAAFIWISSFCVYDLKVEKEVKKIHSFFMSVFFWLDEGEHLNLQYNHQAASELCELYNRSVDLVKLPVSQFNEPQIPSPIKKRKHNENVDSDLLCAIKKLRKNLPEESAASQMTEVEVVEAAADCLFHLRRLRLFGDGKKA